MKDYLNSLIHEQITKANSLKKRTENPLPFEGLSGLKERIHNILNDEISSLNIYLSELEERTDATDNRDIFRVIRSSERQISAIESYGLAALLYQTPESDFLNKLIFKIHSEIQLPIIPPSICCISTDYYYSVPFANVIFVPLSESEFLLHLPDMYHEIGHLVARNRKTVSKFKPIAEAFEKSFNEITSYYSGLIKQKQKEFGPKELQITIGAIHSQWRFWLEEFFCDLFALFTLGPAYCWSHFHLTVKKSEDIHYLTLLTEQSHPSDESRMRMLFSGLYILDFPTEMKKIKEKWNEMKSFWGEPSPQYQYAYNDTLNTKIATIFLQAIEKSGFLIVSQDLLKKNNENYVRFLLNESWNAFWNMSSEDFRNWELEQLTFLKNNPIEAK